jgi:hypothetical protein
MAIEPMSLDAVLLSRLRFFRVIALHGHGMFVVGLSRQRKGRRGIAPMPGPRAWVCLSIRSMGVLR